MYQTKYFLGFNILSRDVPLARKLPQKCVATQALWAVIQVMGPMDGKSGTQGGRGIKAFQAVAKSRGSSVQFQRMVRDRLHALYVAR